MDDYLRIQQKWWLVRSRFRS